jgi:hypothetical protein
MTGDHCRTSGRERAPIRLRLSGAR